MIAGAAVLLLSVAGCAGAESVDVPAPAAGERQSVPARQIDGSALPKGYPREAVTHRNGRILEITAQESGCAQASAELVEENRREVTVLLVHTVPSGDVMCTMDIRYPTVSVELDEPLGARTVVLEPTAREK
ncbi:MAG: hypothetical protein ACRDQW_02895 [Haloechinothrix sp.]